MLKPKRTQAKSLVRLKTLECLQIKPPKTKRRSRQRTRTVTSSLNISKKQLYDKPPTKSILRTLKKSRQKASKGKLETLKCRTQTSTKPNSLELSRACISKTKSIIKQVQVNLVPQPATCNRQVLCQQILSRFQTQMQYQRQLRDMKHHLNQSNIKFVLQQAHFYNIPEQQLQLETDEYDSAYSLSEDISNLGQQLLQLITVCNKHWQKNIRKRFSKLQVMDLFEKLDGQMNGLISVKAFVRELGSLMGRVLRKKDVIRLFRRLENGNTISLCSLMRELCYQYDF